MGCINNIKINDKKFTSVIISNQITNEVNEKRRSHPLTEHIYSKRKIEYIPKTHISQSLEDLIENNPLPFVKIKRNKHHL